MSPRRTRARMPRRTGMQPAAITRCERCQARIAFVLMETTGGKMPIDPDINERGNVVARGEIGRGMRGRIVPPGHPIHEYEDRYMTHHATCPYADRQNGGTADVTTHPQQADSAALMDAARTLFDDVDGLG